MFVAEKETRCPEMAEITRFALAVLRAVRVTGIHQETVGREAGLAESKPAIQDPRFGCPANACEPFQGERA